MFIQARGHPKLRREGTTIHVDIQITYVDAILGSSVQVHFLIVYVSEILPCECERKQQYKACFLIIFSSSVVFDVCFIGELILIKWFFALTKSKSDVYLVLAVVPEIGIMQCAFS